MKSNKGYRLLRLTLIDLTKMLLCVVSMLLTGLFALNLAAPEFLNETGPVNPNNLGVAALLLVIGFAIDLSKYLFWHYRTAKQAYKAISLCLMIFSWAASVSYFVTQESTRVEQARLTTSAYETYRIKVDTIQQEITRKNTLLDQRLASRYHEQWDKSENLMATIAALNTELQQLAEQAPTVGLEQAKTQVNTTAFFIQLSTLFQTSHQVISSVAYGLLALLIEICALGTLSLSQHISTQPHSKRDKASAAQNNSSPQDNDSKNTLKPIPAKTAINAVKTRAADNETCQSQKQSLEQRIHRLRHDILQGQIKPAFTEIKRANYHLSQARIKSVLTTLHEEGHLKKAKRGYRLTSN